MGVSEAIDIDPRHRRTVISLLDRYVRDTQVWAYGSRVAWTSHPASDLDLVVFARSDQTSEVVRLREAFDDSNIPFRVDVHIWDRLPSSFHEEITKNYVILQDSSRIESSRRRYTNSQLGEVAPFSYGKSLPASKRNSAGSVPVFGSNGIIGWHDSAVTSGPTVIIGRKGTVGAVHYSPSPCWPIDTTFYIDGSDFDLVRFKYYLLKSMHLKEMNADSAVPGLNRDDAHSLRIAVPDEATQRKIARTLGALDDRIELNRRMCETLEAMAQALFKSWFIDFGPVRAKMEGQHTGLPDHIADLFPGHLVDSSLGLIPHGWQSLRLGELADAVRGRTYRSSELATSDTALVTLKSFARGGGYRPDGLKPYVGKYNSEQIVQPGELVLACTDVTQAAEIVGRPAIVPPDQRYTTLVASLDTLIIRPSDALPNLIPFLYHLTNSPSFVHYAYAHVSGTTVLHLNRKAIPAFEFPSPPSNLIHAYATLATPLHHRILQTSTESALLVELRDALLPRLMSRNPRACTKDVDSLECGAANC